MLNIVLEGLLAAFLVSLSVGPIFFVLLDISINKGFKNALAYIFGVFLSDLVMLFLLINLGLFNLIHSSEQYHHWFLIIGGALLFLAGLKKLYDAYKHVPVDRDTSDELISAKNLFSSCILGFTVNTMTPTVFFYWVGMATYFSGRAYSAEPNAKLLFFGSIIFGVIFLDVVKSMLANSLKRLLNNRTIELLNYAISTIIICIGLYLIFRGVMSI